jgi:hypothetical protein
MTGGVEMSSDSDLSDSDVSDGTSHLNWKHFEVDHTATHEARSQVFASLKCLTLALPLKSEFHPAIKEDCDSKRSIKVHFQRLGSTNSKWGFSILRCTYSSDELWTKYLERMSDHVADKLNFKADSDLRERLEITIIESPALDGATWKQARDVFHVWSLEELKTLPDYDEAWLKGEGDRLHFAVGRSPRTEFFIYADEASVNSVVNSGQSYREIRAPGTYYFTIVATGLRTPRIVHLRKDGTPVRDYEESEGTRKALRQRFKANEYVGLYGICLDDSWPDIVADDKGGVSRCF